VPLAVWKEEFMRNFNKGVIVGIALGVLLTPLSGQETRRLLAARTEEFLNLLPEDSLFNRYSSLFTERVNLTRANVRGYAQGAVGKAKDTGSVLGHRALDKSQDLASRARLAGHDIADRARHKVGHGSNGTRSFHEPDADLL
jgi:hypothetical protein